MKDHPRLTHFEEHALAYGAIGVDLRGYYAALSGKFAGRESITLHEVAANMPEFVFRGGTSSQLLTWTAHEMHAIANWVHHGGIVYRVAPELTKMLLASEIRIPFDMFRLPFGSFYVEFSGLDILIHNEDGTSDPYLGSYVWNGIPEPEWAPEGEAGKPVLYMFHVSRHRDGKGTFLRTPEGYVRVPETSNVIRSWYPYEDLKREGFSIEVFDRLMRRATDAGRTGVEERFVEEWAQIERLIAAGIVYLTMPDVVQEERSPGGEVAKVLRSARTVRNPSKQRKLLKRLGRMSTQRYLYLPYVKPEGESLPPSGKWKLTKRVPVTGHFKAQPHGPANSLRKTVWIRPYWKGPEGSEMSSTQRKVR